MGEDHTGAIVIANEIEYDQTPIGDALAAEFTPMTDDEWAQALAPPAYWHPRNARSIAVALAAEMADRSGVTMSTFTKGMTLQVNRQLEADEAADAQPAIAADPWPEAFDNFLEDKYGEEANPPLVGDPTTSFSRGDWANETLLGLTSE